MVVSRTLLTRPRILLVAMIPIAFKNGLIATLVLLMSFISIPSISPCGERATVPSELRVSNQPKTCCCGTTDGKCCGMTCCQISNPQNTNDPVAPSGSNEQGRSWALICETPEWTADVKASQSGISSLAHNDSAGPPSLISLSIRPNI